MRKFFAMMALAIIAACAQVGVVAPQSLDEGLAYAQGQVSALEQSAAVAVSSGQLKPAVAQQALALGDQATAAISAARAAEAGGDTSTAQGKLAIATSILNQLAAMLAAQGVHK